MIQFLLFVNQSKIKLRTALNEKGPVRPRSRSGLRSRARQFHLLLNPLIELFGSKIIFSAGQNDSYNRACSHRQPKNSKSSETQLHFAEL